jgi:DNA-binding XRE family transcriptional regulator
MDEAKDNKADIPPERIVKDALWEVAKEYSQCREVIESIIIFLNDRTRGILGLRRTAQSLEERKIIGERLCTYRSGKKMTQKQFGEAVGYSAQFISQIEKGERAIPQSKIKEFAEKLGIDSEALTFAIGSEA